MTWHLNEALTDLTLLPRAMYRLKRYYIGDKIALPPEKGFWRSRVLRSMYQYMKSSEVNMDLFEERDIPVEYTSPPNTWPFTRNPYRWLSRDLLRLVQQLGLIDDSDTINVTALGAAAIKGEEGEEGKEGKCSLESIFISGLLHWQVGKNNCRPVPPLLEILRKLSNKDAVPCPGLMLPEFIKVMRLLEQGEKGENCITSIRAWRAAALDNNFPAADAPFEEIIAAQEDICDYLAMDDESILTDVVRGRTTQIIILASGLAVYGGLLEPVQYMASNPELETILKEQNLTSPGAISGWLDRDPPDPLEVANEVEQWLKED